MTKQEIFIYVVHFTANLLKMRGKRGSMAWWRKGSIEEDQVLSEAARELIEGISNADIVNKIKGEMGLNLRDQVTLEEIQDWAKDRDLRSMKWRN